VDVGAGLAPRLRRISSFTNVRAHVGSPIAHTVIAGNTISDEKYGIITVNALMLSGLPSNHIDGTVQIPISVNN